MRRIVQWPNKKKNCGTRLQERGQDDHAGARRTTGGDCEVRAHHRAVTGRRPVGWVSPGGNHAAETMGILAEQGCRWWGDPCDDDPPYVESVNGRRIVAIPKHWFFNDLRAWNGGGLSGAEAFQSFKYSFDFVYEEAKRGRPGRDRRTCSRRTWRQALHCACVRTHDRILQAIRGRPLVSDTRRDCRVHACQLPHGCLMLAR